MPEQEGGGERGKEARRQQPDARQDTSVISSATGGEGGVGFKGPGLGS